MDMTSRFPNQEMEKNYMKYIASCHKTQNPSVTFIKVLML